MRGQSVPPCKSSSFAPRRDALDTTTPALAVWLQALHLTGTPAWSVLREQATVPTRATGLEHPAAHLFPPMWQTHAPQTCTWGTRGWRLQPVPCPVQTTPRDWQYSQVHVFLASLTDRNLQCSACVRSHMQPARRALDGSATDGPALTHLPCRL